MNMVIPELSLVVLMGASSSGKSTLARRLFKPTEIVSSDVCRGIVSDDENNLAVSKDAFELLHFIVRKRLEAGRLTVVDATNVQPEARAPLVALAREFHCIPVAVVLAIPEDVIHQRNKARPDRNLGPGVIRGQASNLRRSLRALQREGFRHVHVLRSVEDVDAAVVERQRLWNNLRHEHGPFDIIGDVHGCLDELVDLLRRLGCVVDEAAWSVQPAPGRRLIFLGDLVDRGPNTPGVLRLVMNAVRSGAACCVPGNHDMKLMRKLRGRDVDVRHGLEQSLAQLATEPPEFHRDVADFIDGLVSHHVLDDGRLVVAHAGLKESMHGRGSGAVRDFALFGETTGETDEFGLPVRHNWAAEYRGKAMVVYGHTPVPEVEWVNHTLNIDTGCVFGGRLTALRYPEKEIVSVAARRAYAEPARPLLKPGTTSLELTTQQRIDDTLDLSDVMGGRVVGTRLMGSLKVREENAAAALEVMSRFASNPKWLIYLPPTMSPSETSRAPGCLEHPAEALAYFRESGVTRVVCEEKHMGSRAVVIVCRDTSVAVQRFGIAEGGDGICYTRTGRRFFDDPDAERGLLARVHEAVTRAGLWDELQTGWICLDCELMPWSAKAQGLLRGQYAPVGAAARSVLAASHAAVSGAAARGLDLGDLVARTAARHGMVHDYTAAYGRYCWPVGSVDDLRIAPFHILATEGAVHADKSHEWHMQTLARMAGGIVMATPFRVVDLGVPASEAAAIEWWEQLTARGGEGMVVKPMDFVARGARGLVQPAVKCRGREYLRIIYGPEYSAPENLERLRSRGLSAKRSLA